MLRRQGQPAAAAALRRFINNSSEEAVTDATASNK